MLVTGILIAFLDVPAEDAAAFARWYDLDHLPEHVSKPDVVAARRYAAATDVPDDTGSGPARVIGGHAPYLTVYSFGGPLDFAGDDALAGWAAKDAELRAAKRLWRTGRVLHTSRRRLTGTIAPRVRDGRPTGPCVTRLGPPASRTSGRSGRRRGGCGPQRGRRTHR